MTTYHDQSYATLSNAKRGAKRLNIDSPVIEFVDGRYHIVDAVAVDDDDDTDNLLAHCADHSDTSGRIRKSFNEGACGRVWELVASSVRTHGRCVRKEVMTQATAEGIAYYTVRTQIQKALNASRAAAFMATL